ncbi:MAG: DUF2189 domain-containing protein [Gemmatimonadaceae bacterium]|nr:DUF2189 domain-containing protein [Acetobacteraceae bacterium]
MSDVPMAALASSARPEIRRIGLDDLRQSLAEGWADFLAIPTQLVFLCILYPVIGIVAAQVAQGDNLLPLAFPLFAGFALVGPVLATGLYELSKRREQGLPVSWLNAFDVLRNPAVFSVAILGVVLFALLGAWLGSARAIYALTIGGVAPSDLGAFISHVQSSPQFLQLLLIGNAVGFVFALVVLTLGVVSFPLMLDRNTDPLTAVQTSIRAVRANPGTMLVWGFIVATVLALGCLPLFVGLAVAMPVLGHATWHLYRRVVVPV